MKYVSVFVVAVSMFGMASSARAQEPYWGLRAGANLADFAFTPEEPRSDSQLLTGLTAGGFVVLPITSVIAFQPELLYSMQGTKWSAEGLTVKTKIDYVQMPLLARFQTNTRVPIALLVGPSLGFRTRARMVMRNAPPRFSEGFEDTIDTFDVSIATGAAVNVGRVVVDGRYLWGFRNIWRNPVAGDTAKHRVLSLSTGVRF